MGNSASAPSAAHEATPLTVVTKPSFELAMTRSHLYLPRHPDTGHPYRFWGVCASTKHFSVLGAGALAHVNVINGCTLLSIPLYVLGLILQGQSAAPGKEAEAGTAASWGELTWLMVLADVAVTLLFIGFIARTQIFLVQPGYFAEKNGLERRVKAAVAQFGERRDRASSVLADKLEAAFDQKGGIAFLPTSHLGKYASEAETIENAERVLHGSHLVEACSVAVSGWGKGGARRRRRLRFS